MPKKKIKNTEQLFLSDELAKPAIRRKRDEVTPLPVCKFEPKAHWRDHHERLKSLAVITGTLIGTLLGSLWKAIAIHKSQG